MTGPLFFVSTALLSVKTPPRISKVFIFRHSLEVRVSFDPLLVKLMSNAVKTGSTPDWASPKDQRAWFAGASGAVVVPERHRDEL